MEKVQSELFQIILIQRKAAHEKASECNGWRRQAASDRAEINRQEAQMNPWALRFKIWVGMMLAIVAHAFATDLAPNTPEGMLIYHGSGALMDWLLGMVFSVAMVGKRGNVMRHLMIAAIVTNCVGWWLYMAYVPPIYYNTLMWGLTCAQSVCLFFPDRNDATDPWFALVRHAHRRGLRNHSGA